MRKYQDYSSLKDFVPKTKEEQLALEVAQTLSDENSFYHYVQLCQKYPENLIRQILEEVQAVPAHQIRKSRGALFTFLVKKKSHEG